MKKILVLNTGSSSIKYKLFELTENSLAEIKKGEIGGIGLPDGPKNHQVALTLLFEGFGLRDGVLNKIDDLEAIAHRVVYGGCEYQKPTLVSIKIIKNLSKYNSLAPLHNIPILKVMESVFNNSGKSGHRNVPNYAVFDTEFYSDLPDKTKYYPIAQKYQKKFNIQRFGFHGLSHKNSFYEAVKKFGNIDRMISIHLGAGCSITAIKDGQVVDTSMGFTPLEGLMMGTRCGDIDPGIILYLLSKRMSSKDISCLLNNQSGLLGVSEASSDMKDILFLAGEKIEEVYQPKLSLTNLSSQYQQNAKLALEMFVYRVQKYIGAYMAALGGLDVLTFTGEIGIGSSVVRTMILKDIKELVNGVKILIIPTDEEYQIAKEILPLIHEYH